MGNCFKFKLNLNFLEWRRHFDGFNLGIYFFKKWNQSYRCQKLYCKGTFLFWYAIQTYFNTFVEGIICWNPLYNFINYSSQRWNFYIYEGMKIKEISHEKWIHNSLYIWQSELPIISFFWSCLLPYSYSNFPTFLDVNMTEKWNYR